MTNNISRGGKIMNESILCSDVIFKRVFIDLEGILNKFIYDVTGLKFSILDIHLWVIKI